VAGEMHHTSRAVSFLNFDKATKQTGRGFVTLNPNKIKLGINYDEKSSFSPTPLPPAPLCSKGARVKLVITIGAKYQS
jgi:hypothetical protein